MTEKWRIRTFICRTSRRVIGAKIFVDIVFDEGTGSPTIDRKVRVSAGVESSAICDRSEQQKCFDAAVQIVPFA